MTDSIQDYVTAKKAAEIIGIEYSTLIARIRKKKIDAKKLDGAWNLLIHKDEVKRAQQAEEKKHAIIKSVEGSAR